MAPRYVKKIHEFSQREKSAETYFMNSTCHSSTEVAFNPKSIYARMHYARIGSCG